MHNDNDVNPLKLVTKLGLNRRQFFAATTGMAAAVTMTGAAAKAAPGANGVLIPAPRRGIILYTVRDAVGRDPLASPYASGFKEVLTELSSIGYRQIEFAGFRQHANAEGGADLNTVAGATHAPHVARRPRPRGRGQPRLHPVDHHRREHRRIRHGLRDRQHPRHGPHRHRQRPHGQCRTSPTGRPRPPAGTSTGSARPATASSSTRTTTTSPTASCSTAVRSTRTGRPTRSSGVRRLEHFLANTDPKYVFLEMDIYWAHVAQYKHKSYTAPDGSVVTSIFDPAAVVAAQTMRFPLFHAKDGKIDTHPGQRLRHGAVRPGRHRLLDVPASRRCQGLRTTRCGRWTPPRATP